MAVRLETNHEGIKIIDRYSELNPATKTTLILNGFSRIDDGLATSSNQEDLVLETLEVLNGSGTPIEIDLVVDEIIRNRNEADKHLEESRLLGEVVKNGDLDRLQNRRFIEFLSTGLERRLLSHQVKAALHLVSVAHGANFSVPGAGKTSVVLAVYEYLRLQGFLTSLFVVGPRSCFMPWRTEFELTLGRIPTTEVLAGGDISERRHRYYPKVLGQVELYLTTYQTLTRDKRQVKHLLQSSNNHVFFVIDEAHYMKQDEGIWASAVAETSIDAKKRCVLTGTPFPKSYADGLNQFEVLYPKSGMFGSVTRRKIRYASDKGNHDEARALLEPEIDSLYYRVRKSELNLSDPVVIPPIKIDMNPIERELYDCIDNRIGELEQNSSDLDLDTIIKLQKGRQIRRRQATSYSALLMSAISGYNEILIDPQNHQLNEKILNYARLETPAKIQRLMQEAIKLRNHDEKVVIWANFVGTLFRIKEEFDKLGLQSNVVYGGTPLEDGMDEDSRETIIEKFKDRGSQLDVLIANPAACAESVSLHQTCSNAIYYDLSYNCAEYLQSLDRIHRVGGSEEKVSYYRFLQYTDTFEHEILENLTAKASRMAEVIDQDFPMAMCELSELGIDEDEFIG